MEEFHVNVLHLLSSLGMKDIKQKGNEIECICVFHADTKPSFSMNVNTGLWKCWSCGVRGNAISLIRKLQDLSYTGIDRIKFKKSSAIEILSEFSDDVNIGYLKKELNDKMKRNNIRYFSYQQYLENNEQAIEWLRKVRKITPSISTLANIGWDSNRDSIVIPIIYNLKCVSFIRRNIHYKYYLYTRNTNVHDYVYTIDYEPLGDSVIIVEGALDCLRLKSALIKSNIYDDLSVISILGNIASPRQINYILGNFNYIYLMLDNDQAGRIGTQKFINSLEEKGELTKLSIIEIPEKYKDVGEMKNREIYDMIKNNTVSYLKWSYFKRLQT